MKIQLPACTGLSISLFLLLAACQQQPNQPSPTTTRAVPVHVLKVSESAMPAAYEATGTVRAKTTSVLSSKVMGTVRSMNVSAGDAVNAGQVLVVLDSKDLDAQYESAEAGQQGARSLLTEAESAIKSAESNADLAQVTFQRMKTLYDQRSISNQEFDEAKAKLQAAEASYEMTVAQGAHAQSAIAQSDATVRVAAVNRDYARIVAPFAGVITQKNIDAGSLAVPGGPLLSIERRGSYRFDASVEESKLSFIHLGQKVEVAIDALGHLVTGTVAEVAPTLDPTTRTYIVKVDLPNSESLRSGQFGRARFRTGHTNALVIPASAVIRNGQLQSVMLDDSGVARIRLITTGETEGSGMTVLSGLEPGDQVIDPPPAGLVDGSPVEVRQ